MGKKKKSDVSNWVITVADHVTVTCHAMTKAEAISSFKHMAPNKPYYIRKA